MTSKFPVLVIALTLVSVAPSTRPLWKRGSGSGVVPLSSNFSERFVNDLSQSVDLVTTLQSPYLLHTENSLVFVNRSETRINISFTTPLYDNLKIVSHLPVSLVAILSPDLLEKPLHLSNLTLQRLTEFRELVEELCRDINSTNAVFTTQAQLERQEQIIWSVLSFLTKVTEDTDGQTNIDTELSSLAESLLPLLNQNSYDAVLDYIQCLNDSISSLGLSEKVLSDQLVVVLSVNSFSYTGSFLSQYYERLLNVKSPSQRLILVPPATTNTSSVLLKISLYQTISETIHMNSSLPPHSMLSNSAQQLICSKRFLLPFCPDKTLVVGFSNRIEKGYVVLMMVFAGVSTLLGIVLCCVYYEDRVMASERRIQENKQNFKLDGPNVFTPLCPENQTTSELSNNVVEQYSATSNSAIKTAPPNADFIATT